MMSKAMVMINMMIIVMVMINTMIIAMVMMCALTVQQVCLALICIDFSEMTSVNDTIKFYFHTPTHRIN